MAARKGQLRQGPLRETVYAPLAAEAGCGGKKCPRGATSGCRGPDADTFGATLHLLPTIAVQSDNTGVKSQVDAELTPRCAVAAEQRRAAATPRCRQPVPLWPARLSQLC